MAQKKHPTPPEILHTQVAAKSRLFTVETVELKFSNGQHRQYERVRGGGRGAVMIVALDAEQNMLLVREYCAGTNDYQLGFPKGLIDAGETPFEAANRELKEEAGFGAKHLETLMQVAMSPSYFNSKMDIIVAQDLYPETLLGDEPEPLEVVTWPLSEWEQLLEQHDFTEARSIAALLLLKKWLSAES